MRQIISTILFLVCITQSFAKYPWLETAGSARKGDMHEVKVYFGEYTSGVIEQTGGVAFREVIDFELFVIYPDGSELEVEVTAKEDHFLATFYISQKGTYTVALDNKNVNVLENDFGIFKPQYHAKAKVVVGRHVGGLKPTNIQGIEILDLTEEKPGKDIEILLKVLFKGEPLKENEVSIFISDLWSKKMTTDEHGMVSFKLPWKTFYTIETTYKETVPGSFNGDSYEFIWHSASYSIALHTFINED